MGCPGGRSGRKIRKNSGGLEPPVFFAPAPRASCDALRACYFARFWFESDSDSTQHFGVLASSQKSLEKPAGLV
jgi:hypothetical protein